ncbi:ABC transporter ATP-binding protein [Gilvimarinus algae]|uniref:ATP-binding cassette domain-containing protein n=1 Tax=Gilvimarinus algae TaxID=3058037 RepID=A0ABT8TKB5_9GAMM|nr:ATP-binding cassette domain-containing protein [Gilvimarinus sp. SDUM040014]MDO3383813.1 ATP-binding cassette domain-containing protein [Gilvimarinus sp. SDUM040014]
MIEIEQISKTFGTLQALDKVSMTIGNGEIVGLLGLNGAGKSTLMRLIYGLLNPDSGQIHIDGVHVQKQPEKARSLLGVLPDNAGLYKRLTARENIAYFARLQGMSEWDIQVNTDELIDILGMESIAERHADGFSLGERMKTALARAIVHRPGHILLDEPTNGLDVITTRAVRALLRQQKAEGRSVLFSSHLMYEVENLCDRVLVIAGGRLVAGGSVEDVIAAAGCASLEDAFVSLSQKEGIA